MASAPWLYRGSALDRFHECSLLGLLTSATLALAASDALPLGFVLAGAALLAARFALVWGWLGGRMTLRDQGWLSLLAVAELLAAAAFPAGSGFPLYMLLFLLFAVATLASGEIRREARSGHLVRGGLKGFQRRLALVSVWFTVGVVALAFFFFFLLPRTARAALHQFRPSAGSSFKGLPLVRVRLADGAPPGSLKWRGAALAEYDGWRWFNSNESGEILRTGGSLLLLDRGRRWRNGRRISYEVELRNLATDTLFLAGTPESLQLDTLFLLHTPNDTYRLASEAPFGTRYSAGSLLDESGSIGAAAALSPAAREYYLRLPELDPRIPALARQLAAGASTDAERIRLLTAHLALNYKYSLDFVGSSSLPDFLFRNRRGHCELFASALAVLLRAAGIPTRYVTGFQSGAYNPMTGWTLLRAADAHAWVEAFLPGQGWTTLDPTPPSWTPPSRLLLYADAAQTFWEDWILGYDFDRQWSLVGKAARSRHAWSFDWWDVLARRAGTTGADLASALRRYWRPALAGIGCGLLVALAVWGGLRKLVLRRRVERLMRGEAAASDATLLYRKLLNLLAERGYEKPRWLTPAEFAQVLPENETGRLARQFTTAYNRLRFGQEPGAAPRLVELLAELERAR
jgi:transglutaminase-like putative cysteine protease